MDADESWIKIGKLTAKAIHTSFRAKFIREKTGS